MNLKTWKQKKLNGLGVSNLTLSKSDNKGKQMKALFTYRGRKRTVHFGDKDMKEYPGTKRGDNYCSRSLGIAKKYDIKNDPKSPNFWSRLILWDCKGAKSRR